MGNGGFIKIKNNIEKLFIQFGIDFMKLTFFIQQYQKLILWLIGLFIVLVRFLDC